jgi:hypothetical protein
MGPSKKESGLEGVNTSQHNPQSALKPLPGTYLHAIGSTNSKQMPIFFGGSAGGACQVQMQHRSLGKEVAAGEVHQEAKQGLAT